MQSLARRQRGVHHCSRFFLNEFKRRTTSISSSSSSSLLDHSLSGDPDSVVLVEGNASSRTAVLNRPSFLNALNTAMCLITFSDVREGYRLQKLYKNWEDTPHIGFVVMKGSGRAFCAGGDIVPIRDKVKKGDINSEMAKVLHPSSSILVGEQLLDMTLSKNHFMNH